MLKRICVFCVIGFACLLTLCPQSVVYAATQIEKMSAPTGTQSTGRASTTVRTQDLDVGKGIICKAGEQIGLFKNGDWESCVLKKPVTLTFMPGKVIVFKENTILARYPNGQPAYGTTANGTSFQGLPIKTDSPIAFDRTGTITSFILAGDFKLGQITWKKDTELAFYPKGNIYAGTPARDFPYGQIVLKAGLRNSFEENGNIIRYNY